MSRVVITDLVPGEEATSAGVNATITSWNDAAGSGDLGTDNVRDEGIDRRTLSAAAQAIQAPPATFLNCLCTSTGSSGLVNSAAYAVIPVVTTTGVNLQIGPMTDIVGSGHERVMVRASFWLSADPNLLVECIIQSSPDAAAWTSYDESYQAFMVDRTSGVLTPPPCNCVGSYTGFVVTTPAGSRVYWRVAYRTTAGGAGPPGVNVTFNYAILCIEEYAK